MAYFQPEPPFPKPPEGIGTWIPSNDNEEKSDRPEIRIDKDISEKDSASKLEEQKSDGHEYSVVYGNGEEFGRVELGKDKKTDYDSGSVVTYGNQDEDKDLPIIGDQEPEQKDDDDKF
ncbi:MAG TPA: hypothetical protein VFQ60_00435 [Patescibacteria group bacterium]|nr:hypothetical protein [Patescibacteria group bacterium]